MSEYVKRVDLLAACVEVEYLGRPRLMVSASKIAQLPAVDIREGKWIDAEYSMIGGEIHEVQVCSECNTFYPLEYTGGGHNFCPNCGADMRGADHERENMRQL